MKHLNLKHFKLLLLSLMALFCVTTSYAQENTGNASYDDFCKPTVTKDGNNLNKRWQVKGEILNENKLSPESPKSFTPTGNNQEQDWANTTEEILAYPGATFNLKLTFGTISANNDCGWGSLFVFQLRSDKAEAFSKEDKIFGKYNGDWENATSAPTGLFTNIANSGEEGVSASTDDLTATFPVKIPTDINPGEIVVIRFIVCKTSEGKTYDENPCTTVASQLNYCDYIVRIVEESSVEKFSVTKNVEPSEGGSVSVTMNDSEVTEVEAGDIITVTANNNDGYTLESLEVTGATKVADQENQYTVEDDVTVTATFVKDAPVENWSEITLITMSANKPGDADVSAVTYNGEWVIQNYGASNEYGEEFTKVHGPYIAAPQAGDYLAVKYDVPAKAKYKFSFLSKRKEGLTEGMKLCYGKSLDALTDASDVMDIPTAVGDKPGIETESQTIDLEAGEYYFVYYITKATDKVRVADFRLYQLDGSVVEPTPKYTVTLNKPENGNLSVTYNNGEKDITVSTDDDATEPQTFNVAKDTKLTVTVTPADGYQLATLSPEMTEVTDNENVYEYTVTTENVNIEATFKQIDTPVEKYAQNFGQGVGAPTGDAHRSWTNTVFKTSTDGTKTVEVNYETKQNSYEIYSDALVSEANKATVYLGEQFDLTINGGMHWLYTLVYIDWNGDGVFDETVDGKENLGFNPVTERDFGAGSTTNANVRTYKVKVPDNAKVGDTRVRIILGWKQTNLEIIPSEEADKERREMTSTTIDDKKNAMARDFSLCILDNQLAERTITLAVNDQSMGKAVITGTDNTSITTSDINVSVTAIPEEGYMFVNWTDEKSEILSTDNPYLYGGLESATITANFAVKTYPVMTRKYTTINQQNRYLKEVVATVGGEAQNLFTATSLDDLPLTKYTNAGEVTESGALIDKTDTPIVLEQGTTSFDMTFKAWTETFSVNDESCSQQIVWTSQAIYVDWNNDKDFDDANECLGAVGTPATENNFGDTSGSPENGWTRTLNVPSDVAAGTYRMRVVYNENSVTDWDKTFFSAGKGNINAGVSYDFEIQIEGQVEPTPETVTLNKPVNGNLSVTYNNGTDDVTVSTDDATGAQTFEVAEGTKLTVTVTPDDGYQLETLSPDMTKVEDRENVYEYTVIKAVTIKATFTEIPDTDPIIGVGTDNATAPVVSTASSPTWFVMKSSHLTAAERQNRFMYWNEENSRLECTQHNDGIKLSEISDAYRWRFEDAGDGNIYIINKATGKALSVPANASSETGNANINTPLNLEETGSKWSFALSSTVNPTEALPNQYCFDYVDYAEADRAAYLNAMDGQAAIPYGITIYEMGVQNASGWFIYEAPVIVKMYNITVKKPVNGNLVISYTVNDEMQSIETYNFENDSKVFSIPEGTLLSISINPEFDYELDQILPEGMEEQTGLAGDKYYEYTVTGDATIEATFKPIQYGKVSAETPEEGSIEIQVKDPMRGSWGTADESFLEQVEFGTKLRAKVEANTGYNLVSVMKNQEELSTEEEGYYYFTVDAEAITISAEFEAQTFTLTKEVTPAEGGSVSVTVDGTTVEGTVKYGDVITVTVTVNEGYLLKSIVVEGADAVDGEEDQYTVTGSVTITATFTEDTSSINSIENGTVYYNAEEEVLYTGAAKSVRVYDLSGRLVLNAENQDNVSLAELAEGIYTAVVDGKAIKLNK